MNARFTQFGLRKAICCVCALLTLAVFALGAARSGINTMQNNADATTPYSLQVSNEAFVTNFDLGNGRNYYSKLNKQGENILLFWSGVCPHCENVINFIDSSDSVDVLKRNLFTVSEDASVEDIQGHKGKFPILLDAQWETFDTLGLQHLPSALVVDGTGQILGSAEGEHDVKALLEEYITRNS